MKALCWHGKGDIRYDTVPDPKIEDPQDAIIKVTSCAICGSDLHLMDGYIPFMESGDVLGHECMGEVVEVGKETKNLKVGDRVVIPFTINCGKCDQCRRGNFSVCENSNRNASLAAKMFGHTTAGLFGYSHLTGGYAGGQAEYVRVPFADPTAIKVPKTGLTDDQLLFLSDIFPTGWQAAVHCDIQPTDVVAIWGCGPVAQFAIKSALMLGAHTVIAIDRVPERLALAKEAGAITINFDEEPVLERLNELTGGRGPDKCIEAVGMEAHAGLGAHGLMGMYDKAKSTLMLETERPVALREAIYACRPGGIVSVAGVFGGLADKIPLGAFMNKGLTMRTGQTHVKRFTDDLLRRIEEGQIDPTFVITHKLDLKDGPEAYHTFRDKKDGCIKVVLRP
ncbi:zinc-dependent alcohol dehydrogenase [Indioceanicola profundi]|uniref:zinc-dependent alcohol dehydrogenase n=1 Tax=Indioceanicola profundi TaxID=2220096 RepID=UPI000E6AC053|nr:zinc-dependent alcohol dehydrogenase [Indioceanicola profundi]